MHSDKPSTAVSVLPSMYRKSRLNSFRKFLHDQLLGEQRSTRKKVEKNDSDFSERFTLMKACPCLIKHSAALHFTSQVGREYQDGQEKITYFLCFFAPFFCLKLLVRDLVDVRVEEERAGFSPN